MAVCFRSLYEWPLTITKICWLHFFPFTVYSFQGIYTHDGHAYDCKKEELEKLGDETVEKVLHIKNRYVSNNTKSNWNIYCCI